MPFPWQAWVVRQWQSRSWASALLWPVSGLTWLVVMWRRRQRRIHPPLSPGVPVVAVGNVIAGGAGKTPLVMALAMHWKSQGIKLGVVARGLQLRRHLTSRDSGALLQHADEQQEACISYVNGIAHAKGQLADGVDGRRAISVANGSHCHDTMMITLSSGKSVNQSTGVPPKKSHTWASTP